MVFFKRFFGAMTGESVTFFNIIASKTTWAIAFIFLLFIFVGFYIYISQKFMLTL